MSSLCSISEIPWERWRVPRNRRSFGRVSSPEKHQDGVDHSAAEDARGAMADCHRGRHHGLLPAVWAECCKCPSSGHGISWGAPFLYNRFGLYPLSTSMSSLFWLFLISNDSVRAMCGKIHRDLYCLGAFKTKRVWGKPCCVKFERIHVKVEEISKERARSFHFWYSDSLFLDMPHAFFSRHFSLDSFSSVLTEVSKTSYM